MSTHPIPGLIHSKPYELLPKPYTTSPTKISLLEDKAHFFEGQVNPLHSQNLQLKQQLIYSKRIISQKTKLLKGLLPTVDKHGKSRELFMETATLEEICGLIEEDWAELRGSNSELRAEIVGLNKRLQEREEEILRKVRLWEQQEKGLKGRIEGLEKQILEIDEENRGRIQKLERKYLDIIEGKDKEMEVKNKQNQTYKQNLRMMEAEMTRRTDENRQRMKILQNDYDTLNERCEEAKRLMATVFEAQMKDKVDEMNRAFEAVITAREQQYNEEIESMRLISQELRKQIDDKETEIRTQLQITSQKQKQLQAMTEKRKDLEKLTQKIQTEKTRCLNEIDKLKSQRSTTLQILKQKQRQLTLLTQKFQSFKQEYLRQRTKLKLQLQTTQAELMESKKQILMQKSNYQNQILNLRSDLDDQISSTNVRLKSMEEEWGEKYRRVVILNVELDGMIKDEKRKSEMMGKEVLKVRQEFEQKLVEEKEKINQRIEAIRSEEQQKRKALEDQHKTEKVEWERVFEGRIKEVRNLVKQEIKELNKQIQGLQNERAELESLHQQKISQIIATNLQHLQKISEEHTKQQDELKASFSLKQEQHHKAIKHMEERIILKDQQIERQKQQTKELIRQEKAKFQSEISALKHSFEEEKEALNKAFNAKILDLTHSFEEKIQELKSLNQTESLASHYESQIEELNQLFALEKKRMQEEHLTRLKEVGEEHERECEKIKTSLEVKVIEVEKRTEEQISEIQREVERVKKQHQSQLVSISKRFQQDIGGLNILLEDQKQDHIMTKMTKQQKIDYLNSKISDIKQQQKSLESEKIQLSDDLILKQKQLRQIEENIQDIVSERVKDIEEEKEKYKVLIDQKLEEKQMECSIKLKEAMEENLKFSANLHEEFQRIKKLHDDQYEEWQIRYEELEQLFMERPSRPEDLSIIKQLKEAREGMERMVEAAEKRVKAAHDIVRYLQLELQNYKDTYDIFGPNTTEIQQQLPSPSNTKKLRLSTNITQDIRLKNDSPFTNQKLQRQYRKSISYKISSNEGLPPINKSTVEAIESKSFEVIESAQKFMESITKANKHEPLSPLGGGRRRGNSMKKGRRPSIAQGYQESCTIEGGEFQIIPRKVSIRKNNSGVFNNN